MSVESVSIVTVHFSGHVQGVGFRYAVLQLAKGFEVSGAVRNLADGRVEVVAEGDGTEIEAFLEAIGEQMSGYIRKTERRETRGARGHAGFSIL